MYISYNVKRLGGEICLSDVILGLPIVWLLTIIILCLERFKGEGLPILWLRYAIQSWSLFFCLSWLFYVYSLGRSLILSD